MREYNKILGEDASTTIFNFKKKAISRLWMLDARSVSDTGIGK